MWYDVIWIIQQYIRINQLKETCVMTLVAPMRWENWYVIILINRGQNNGLHRRIPEEKKQTTRSTYIVMSFIQNLGSKMRRILELKNTKVYFASEVNNLQTWLGKVKYPVPSKQKIWCLQNGIWMWQIFHRSNQSTIIS